MNISILQANNGDSIHLSFNDENGIARNILIDGGKKPTYEFKDINKKKKSGSLKILIEHLREKSQIFDLVILTHVDEDHIGGFISWIENDPNAHEMIGDVWFNSGQIIKEWLDLSEKPFELRLNLSNKTQTSIEQGVLFETYLDRYKIWKREIFYAGMSKDIFGLHFKILSPDQKRLKDLLKRWKKERPNSLTSSKVNDHGMSLEVIHGKNIKIDDNSFEEDSAVPNGSSIAFIMSSNKKDFLFLGDAFPSVITKSLEEFGYSEKNKLNVAMVKVAHHGAQSNTSPKLFRMINSSDFIISTNSKQDNHPHKQLLGRLIDHHPDANIHFNYAELIEKIFSKKDYVDFPKFKALPITKAFEYE